MKEKGSFECNSHAVMNVIEISLSFLSLINYLFNKSMLFNVGHTKFHDDHDVIRKKVHL